MIFNSLDFAIFLPIVFILYWFVANKNLKQQNLIIVIASYLFYGWWDWKFLFLIFLSTVIDFGVGYKLALQENNLKRKALLWTSITINISVLFFFKYFNFFIENFMGVFSFLGAKINPNHLNIILPIGISFYTFQTLSYTIDVYNRKLTPTKDFIAFSAFISFFPQLVAGPIERAKNLLPQFYTKRSFNYDKATDGLRQILWGLFKKVVIADNCAQYANQIFNNSENMNGSTLFLGALFFSFQIYGDFSGYSDIAIGTARLFGFDLMKNFAFPYFSRDIGEFWRRWHISLSTWFRDYVYIPLGGSRGSTVLKIRNVFIIFIVSGFWHGANWTFIIWGSLNAFYFLPLLLTKKNRKNIKIVAQGKHLPTFKEFLAILFTFCLTTLTWVFFRAENLPHAINYLIEIFSKSLFETPTVFPKKIIILILFFIIVEWLGRTYNYAIEKTFINKTRFVKFIFYYFLLFLIYFFGNFNQNIEFIYFQF